MQNGVDPASEAHLLTSLAAAHSTFLSVIAHRHRNLRIIRNEWMSNGSKVTRPWCCSLVIPRLCHGGALQPHHTRNAGGGANDQWALCLWEKDIVSLGPKYTNDKNAIRATTNTTLQKTSPAGPGEPAHMVFSAGVQNLKLHHWAMPVCQSSALQLNRHRMWDSIGLRVVDCYVAQHWNCF